MSGRRHSESDAAANGINVELLQHVGRVTAAWHAFSHECTCLMTRTLVLGQTHCTAATTGVVSSGAGGEMGQGAPPAGAPRWVFEVAGHVVHKGPDAAVGA